MHSKKSLFHFPNDIFRSHMVCLCGIACIGSLCKAARGNGHCRQHQHGQGAAQQPDGHSIHIPVHHFQAPFPQAARRTPFRPGQHPFSWLRAPSIGPQRSQTRKKAQSEHTPGSIVCVKFMIALRAGFVKKNEELSLHSILAFISFVCPRPKRPETVRSRGVSFMIITYTRQPRAFLLIQASFDTAPVAKN